MPRPLQATVDMCALASNHALARRLAPRAKVLATIKANAYGHGMRRVERVLHDADGFAVCEIDKAAALRARARSARRDRQVLLLEGFFSTRDLLVCSLEGISAVVHDIWQVEMLERTRLESPIDVFVKMNTGMNRLGFAPARFGAAVERLRSLSAVRSITLMTHFASADEDVGVAAKQAVAINTSLSALGKCTRALAVHAAYVPYRESTLTQLLRSSLSGKASLAAVITVAGDAAPTAMFRSTPFAPATSAAGRLPCGASATIRSPRTSMS
jgi:alanine racemase